ncbi:MAG: terminase small subunit [Pseudomonadota bacterium]
MLDRKKKLTPKERRAIEAPLTARQRRFVEEILLDPNATQAAIKAGYSLRNSRFIASQLLERPAVRRAIDAAKSERSQRVQIDADWVLKRLHSEAEADLADIFDKETGALLPAHTWPAVWRKGLVQGIDVFEERDADGNVIGHTRKVRLSDRVRRLELIGKHVRVNAFQEIIKHKGLDGLADRLARMKSRKLRIAAGVIIDADMPDEPSILEDRPRFPEAEASSVEGVPPSAGGVTVAESDGSESCDAPSSPAHPAGHTPGEAPAAPNHQTPFKLKG